MGLADLFTRKLRRRVTLAIAVPTDKTQFEQLAQRGSDFISNLKQSDWESYAKTAKTLNDEVAKMSARGVKVIQHFDSQSFDKLDGSDIIIILAHHTQHGSIELFDCEMQETEFVRRFPKNFSGIVDLSSCHSKSLIEIAKHNYPNAFFLGVNAKTSLVLKCIIIENVIKLIAKDDTLDYRDAYGEVLDMLERYSEQFAVPKRTDVVYLGNRQDASVYAPASVKRGQEFIIQLYIYDAQNKQEVDETAKMVDEDAVEKNRKKIKMPLVEGDIVQAQLTCMGNGNFEYDRDVAEVEYDGDTVSFEFIVNVSEQCTADAFVGKIKVAVNNEPAGDFAVKVKVGDTYVSDGVDYSFTKRDVEKEKANERALLMAELNSQLVQWDKMAAESQNEAERKTALQMAEVCRVCIGILNEEPVIRDDKYKTVFVSSTSDMATYRHVVRDQILSCHMYPEMYEDWGQDNRYPCYECCRRVKNSDVILCVLGPQYGFVEPTIGMSMTEIEFRVAMLYGKTALVYVLDSHTDSQQQSFIDDVCEKRLVKFFDDENKLAVLAARELAGIKN